MKLRTNVIVTQNMDRFYGRYSWYQVSTSHMLQQTCLFIYVFEDIYTQYKAQFS